MDVQSDFWRRCSNCKKPIGFRARYWSCSVSTCNRKATLFVFCAVPCWDAHVPIMNHRDAWADEKLSPSREEWRKEQAAGHAAGGEARPIARPAPSPAPSPAPGTSSPEPVERSQARSGEQTMDSGAEGTDEILIVGSKLKAYIRARSEMNTSASVLDALSDRVREMCDRAIEVARRDGRKTVMDRDFE